MLKLWVDEMALGETTRSQIDIAPEKLRNPWIWSFSIRDILTSLFGLFFNAERDSLD
jgi:hypothetical protein